MDKTKAEVVIPVRNAVVVTVGGPQVPSIVVSGTPAHNPTDNAQAMALGTYNTQCLCCQQALEVFWCQVVVSRETRGTLLTGVGNHLVPRRMPLCYSARLPPADLTLKWLCPKPTKKQKRKGKGKKNKAQRETAPPTASPGQDETRGRCCGSKRRRRCDRRPAGTWD